MIDERQRLQDFRPGLRVEVTSDVVAARAGDRGVIDGLDSGGCCCSVRLDNTPPEFLSVIITKSVLRILSPLEVFAEGCEG